jgi:hypothetical protein
MFDFKFKNAEVKRILENAYNSDQRLRLFYGENGKVWDEEFDVIGYVGRSTGAKKVPLLVYNRSSLGGGVILTNNIVGIYDTKTRKELYWDSDFKRPRYEATAAANVYNINDDRLYARCDSVEQAERLAAFMSGKRFSK